LQLKLYNYGWYVFNFLNANLISFKGSIHGGVSTGQVMVRQAIPESLFAEAIDDYIENSETDDDGDRMEA
jgi:hypothetical protein